MADQALVRTLYYGHSQAFMTGGILGGTEYVAAHNHPQMAYTAAECEATYWNRGISADYVVSSVPDVAGMALDPGWVLTDTRFGDFTPDGRTYIVPVTVTEADPTAGFPTETTQRLVHVTILNNQAYYYEVCE